MMIPNSRYEFTPPSGGLPITINGMQDYSPGQVRKTDVYKLDAPDEHAALFGGHVDFDNWKVLIATLARMFCNGDEKAATDRMILKWSDRSPL